MWKMRESMESINNKSNHISSKIAEILLRLPAKSLHQFKCVCKSWYSLISSQHFIELHFKHALTSPPHRLLYIPFCTSGAHSIDVEESLHHHSTLPVPPIPYINDRSKRSLIRFQGSCRGFVLLKDDRNLILWNPSTGAHKTLPHPPNATEIVNSESVLGYDVATDDYLVVMASVRNYRYSDKAFCLEIFSVRTNSWEQVMHKRMTTPNLKCRLTRLCESPGLFFNGVVHWQVWGKVLICFDLRLRKLSKMAMPYGYRDHNNKPLLVLRGCLAVCDGVEIWVMKEYKVHSSWTKYFDVCNKALPLCINKAGELIGLTIRPSSSETLLKLNKKGEEIESRGSCDGLIRVNTLYMESLMPLP